MLETLLQTIVNGILLGGLYALMAVGLSLCFGVMRVANSAQAAMAVLSAYIAYWLFVLYDLDPFFSIPICMGILFIIGLGIYRTLITRIMNTPSPTLLSFLLLSAVAIIMENSMVMVAGGNIYRAIYASYTATSLKFAGIVFPIVRIAGFVISISAIVVLSLVLKFTYIGKAMRAIAQDRDAAMLMGVNATQIGAITFGIGASLSGVAGVFLALIYAFYPAVQGLWIAKLYAIVIFGGMGSIAGALLSSMILGIVEAVIGVYIPTMWAYVAAYVILLLTLFIRPSGLLGRKET
ncbi:MAG: branched-chain amino acid ABC transporter permease [Candidatus Bathyarchaeia archaeon]